MCQTAITDKLKLCSILCSFSPFQSSPTYHQESSKADGRVAHILFLLLSPLVSKSKMKRDEIHSSVCIPVFYNPKNHVLMYSKHGLNNSECFWTLPLRAGQLNFTLAFIVREASAAKINTWEPPLPGFLLWRKQLVAEMIFDLASLLSPSLFHWMKLY